MDDYRLQLALYSVILESSEMLKPEDERRIVLPPAISVGASGKMIRLTDADYEQAKSIFILYWNTWLLCLQLLD